MTIGSNGSASAGFMTSQTNFSFVDGPLKKTGSTAFVYPLGDVYTATGPTTTAKWARFATVSGLAASDEYTAEYHKANDPCNVSQVVSSTNGAGINHVSYKEYWDFTRVVGTSTPVVKLYWEDNSSSSTLGSAISSPTTTDLHVAECVSSTWQDRGATGITTAGATGTITSNIATTFTTGTIMPFTFMTPTGVNPLPVSLVSFTGHAEPTSNILNWETASETNNSHFDLEKSSNGIDFKTIAAIDGNGTTTEMSTYEYRDGDLLQGLNYYRLNQFDFNGDQKYSEVIVIDRSEESSVQVYPNPTNDLVTIVSQDDIATVVIYNALGEIVYNSDNESSITFKPLADGIYTVKTISRQGKPASCRFIKK